jgi:basic membrane protein A and related proteins
MRGELLSEQGRPSTQRTRGVVAALLALLLVAAVLAACGSDDDSDDSGGSGENAADSGGGGEKISVAVLLSGTPTSDSYGEVQYGAIEAATQAIGADRFELKPVNKVPYTPQATQITLQLFQQGTDVVIDVGGYGKLFADACKQSPESVCINYGTQLDAKSLQSAPNLGTVYLDQAPAFYVEGVAAGKMTKSGKLGYISAFKVPFNTAVVNAFAMGCRSVRPDCEVSNVYINSYYDPPKTVEATRTLLNAGVDVMAYFVNDITPLKIAQTKNAHGFGIYTDQSDQAPRAWVTGLLFQDPLTKIYQSELEKVLDDSWEPGTVQYGPDPVPNIPLAPWGEEVPEEAISAAEDALEKIKDENPFQGPITDADGKVQIPEGDEIEIRGEYMYSQWTWPVEGVKGL